MNLTHFLLTLVNISLLLIPISKSCSCFYRSKRDENEGRYPRLRFNTEGQFKIANFADLHYGEDPHSYWGPIQDKLSTMVVQNILDDEKPDFVVFTGDQLTGENIFANATQYIDILLKPLIKGKYRWASIYGNHDLGKNFTRLDLLAAEQKYNLSYTQQMTPSEIPGVTNYYLLIYPPENVSQVDTDIFSEKASVILWFFDSQGGKGQPHNVDPKVVEWFVFENKKLQENHGNISALVFFHIPPIEFIDVQDSIDTNSHCIGLVDDDVSAQDRNTGLMTALNDAGNVKTIFVGHDHGNAWCCFWKKIEVCYNRHTGHGGYGSWARGSRIVVLDYFNLNKRKNYIRMEDGEIQDSFPKIRKNKHRV